MAKRSGITVALVAVTIVAVVLTGAYYLRIQLLTELINRTLRDSDLVLLQLDQLDVGFDGLKIEQLVFTVGPDRAPQSLRQLDLRYSLLNARPQRLEIGQATLQLPANQDDTGTVAITDLLNSLLKVPLESASIAALEVQHWSHPLLQFPLAVTADWQKSQVALRLLSSELELALTLHDREANGLYLELNLATNGGPTAALDLGLHAKGDTLEIDGGGELDLDSLAGYLTPLPEPLTGIDGRVLFRLNARMNNELSSTALQHGSINVQPDTKLTLAAHSATQPAWDTRVAIHLPQGVALETFTAESGQAGTRIAASNVTATLTETHHGLDLQGSLEQLSCLVKERRCKATLSASAYIPELIANNGARLESGSLKMTAAAAISTDQLSLEIAPGELLRIGLLEQGELLAHNPALVSETPGSLEYRFQDSELNLKMQRLNLQLPRVKLPELNIATNATLSELEVSFLPQRSPFGSARLVAAGVNLQRPSGWLPALAMDSNIKLTQDQLSLDAQLGSGRSRELLSLTANYSLEEARLKGQLRTNDIHFDPGSRRLSEHFASWPYPWDLMGGKLALQADLEWPGSGDKPVLQAAINGRWEDLVGAWGETGFFDLDGQAAATFSSPDQLVIAKNARVSLARLDIGVPIENIEASFRLDSGRQQIQVPTLEARLFGGRVWTNDVTYRGNRSSNRIDIGVDGLQVAQLLAATGYEAVEGTGSISGLLPLNVNARGITMARGMLAAKDPGGIFRYHAELAADSNAALTQVSEALSNYHYTIFQTEADYLENGDLELRMQLRGRNPDMAEARPIHLNLNLTDNIPMLLRSLQSGRVIADLVSGKMEDSGK